MAYNNDEIKIIPARPVSRTSVHRDLKAETPVIDPAQESKTDENLSSNETKKIQRRDFLKRLFPLPSKGLKKISDVIK